MQNLYDGHCCRIAADGTSREGFDITAGIRQGCPLSPLLFALVIDIVLRRIQRLLPDATVRAFADDIAIVLPDVEHAMPTLEGIFEDLADIAGLGLHLAKCVLIPLWPTSNDLVKQVLCE